MFSWFKSDRSIKTPFTTEETRNEARLAKLQAFIAASNPGIGEAQAVVSSLRRQARLNHFTELLTVSMDMRGK